MARSRCVTEKDWAARLMNEVEIDYCSSVMSRLSQRHPATRARGVLNLIVSIGLGSGFGVIAAEGMGGGLITAFALVIGGIIGLLASEALMFGLQYGPWVPGVLMIAIPTATVAYFSAAWSPSGWWAIGISPVLSTAVYIALACVRGKIGQRRYAPLPSCYCPQCDYDRRGLPAEAVCPECASPPDGRDVKE